MKYLEIDAITYVQDWKLQHIVDSSYGRAKLIVMLLWIERLYIVKMAIVPKLICKFNTIQINFSPGCICVCLYVCVFYRNWQVESKIYMKLQRT